MFGRRAGGSSEILDDASRRMRDRILDRLPVVERRLDLGGVSTAVLEGGEGPPLILLHEQGEFGASWMRVIPVLVKSYRVIAPDLPGHGTSHVNVGELGAPLLFGWLDALIDATCSAPPILAGHMLGGAIAARYAVDHSSGLGHLVLVDSFGLGRFRPPPRFVIALVRYLVHPSERSHNRLHDYCTVDLEALRNDMGEGWGAFQAYALDRIHTSSVKSAVGKLMRTVGVPPIPREDLARISVATTLIWGRHDPVVKPAIAEAAAARYGWGLRVIDDAGDMPATEAPEEFVMALHGAVGEVARSERA